MTKPGPLARRRLPRAPVPCRSSQGEASLAAAIAGAGSGGDDLPPNGGGLGGAPCRASLRGGDAVRDVRRRVVIDGREARVRQSYGVTAGRSLQRRDSGALWGPDLGLAGLGRAASTWELPGSVVPLLVGAHGVATLSSTRAASFWSEGCLNLLHCRRAVDDSVEACLSASKNKGGGLRVPTCAKTKICQLSVPINLARVSCSERIRWQTPLGDSSLEIARSGGIQSCTLMFFSDRLVSEGALQISIGC
jgi:hypothetical protein